MIKFIAIITILKTTMESIREAKRMNPRITNITVNLIMWYLGFYILFKEIY